MASLPKMKNRLSKRLSLSALLKPKLRLSVSTKLEKPPTAPAKYSQDTLEQNGIFMLETSDVFNGAMPDIPTLCGESVPSSPTIVTDVDDLHRNLNNMKRNSSREITSLLSYFFEGVAGTQEFEQQISKAYSFHVGSGFEGSESKAHHLRSPQPNLSYGYTKADFASFFDSGLQDDIIEARSGQLFDLGKISQPIKGHYWPFFVVEVSEVSMLVARQAAAVAAASSNHAVKLLSVLTRRPGEEETESNDTDPAESFDICFSLTVYGQIATFNIHTPRGPVEYSAVALKTYRLTEWRDLADLATSVRCIMTWARSKRLPALIGKLQALDHELNGPKHFADRYLQPGYFETEVTFYSTPGLGMTQKELPTKNATVVYPAWVKRDHTGQIDSWI